MKKIIIYEDENHALKQTVEEVLKQLNKGYTSGVNPNWEIQNE